MLRQSRRQLILHRAGTRSASTPVPPRLNTPGVVASLNSVTVDPAVTPRQPRRPTATSFGGISINNTGAPSQQTDGRPSNGGTSGTRQNGGRTSWSQRTGDRSGGNQSGRPKSVNLGWSDGTVGTSLFNRLKAHRAETAKRTEASHAPKPATDTNAQREPKVRREDKPASLVRQPAQGRDERPRREAYVKAEGAGTKKADVVPTETASGPTTHSPPPRTRTNSRSSAREVRPAPVFNGPKLEMTSLETTNLAALFMTAPGAESRQVKSPTSAPSQEDQRVQRTLERTTGDYSRYSLWASVSRRAPVTPSTPLRYARHALATRRDLNLAQRRRALRIISGLAEPVKEVRV